MDVSGVLDYYNSELKGHIIDDNFKFIHYGLQSELYVLRKKSTYEIEISVSSNLNLKLQTEVLVAINNKILIDEQVEKMKRLGVIDYIGLSKLSLKNIDHFIDTYNNTTKRLYKKRYNNELDIYDIFQYVKNNSRNCCSIRHFSNVDSCISYLGNSNNMSELRDKIKHKYDNECDKLNYCKVVEVDCSSIINEEVLHYIELINDLKIQFICDSIRVAILLNFGEENMQYLNKVSMNSDWFYTLKENKEREIESVVDMYNKANNALNFLSI